MYNLVFYINVQIDKTAGGNYLCQFKVLTGRRVYLCLVLLQMPPKVVILALNHEVPLILFIIHNLGHFMSFSSSFLQFSVKQ